MSSVHDAYKVTGAAPATLRVETATGAREIAVPPLARIRVTGEVVSADDRARWPILPLRSRTAGDAGVWPVPGAVRIRTLRVRRAGASGKPVCLRRGRDYTLDAPFAGITPRQGVGADVYVLDYEMRLQRVDVLAVKEGELRLFTGGEALVTPRWPRLPPGWTGLARVHGRFCDTLEADAVFPIARAEHGRLINTPVLSDQAARMPGGVQPDDPPDADSPLWTEALDYDRHVIASAAALGRLREGFRAAREYSLVFFGDSITQGGDVPPDWRWTARFGRHLTAYAAGRAMRCVNAGLGGTSSSVGRERFERDVLVRRPNAVTILFALNDKKLDDRTFVANHEFFIEALRARNAEPVLFTSNMNTAIWMNGLDHAQQRIVDFCRKHDLICLDAYSLWKSLPAFGIPYESLLSNGINHPDGVAAGVFFELLKRAFGV
jgi:lysophospholipase L1-like esterase